jgi:hypothetical protein
MRTFRRAIFVGLSLIAGAAFLLVAGAGDGSAEAGKATFKLTNKAPNAVMVKFFSKTRPVVWPDANHHELLNDDAQHSFALSCQVGEEICYGASDSASNKRYWGVGLNNDKACKDCCLQCGHNVAHGWSLILGSRTAGAPPPPTPKGGSFGDDTVLVPAEE